MTSIRIILLAGFFLLLVALVHGGIYVGVTAGGGDHPLMYRINRFTGKMVICEGNICLPVTWREPIPLGK